MSDDTTAPRKQWTREDSVRLDILMGLRAGLKHCHGMRRQLDERQQPVVGDAIMKQFKLSGVEFVPPPPYKPWHQAD